MVLTKAFLKKHKAVIERGFPISTLSRILGVARVTGQRWLSRAAAAEGKRKRDLTGMDKLCLQFKAMHEKGQARLLQRQLTQIEECAETDWRAAKWLLSVLMPEDFSTKALSIRAVARQVHGDIPEMEIKDLLAAIERESLEIILTALRERDLGTALLLLKGADIDTTAFDPLEFLKGMQALKQRLSTSSADTDMEGSDSVEAQLMGIETEPETD